MRIQAIVETAINVDDLQATKSGMLDLWAVVGDRAWSVGAPGEGARRWTGMIVST
jgi:hypothetical protein